MTNSADPDQLASEEKIQISWLPKNGPFFLQKPADLDLHCLLRQGICCVQQEGVKK